MQLLWVNRAKWVPYKNRFQSPNISPRSGVNYQNLCRESLAAISLYEEVMVPAKRVNTSEYIPLSKLT